MIPGGREVHRTLRLAASVLGLVVVGLVTLGIALLAMVAGGCKEAPSAGGQLLCPSRSMPRWHSPANAACNDEPMPPPLVVWLRCSELGDP